MKKRTTSLLFILLVVVPSCTDEDSPPAAGGAVELRFGGASSSNVDSTPLPATSVGVVFRDPERKTRVLGVIALEPEVDGFRRKAWQLALPIIGDLDVGATYSAALGYEQFPTPGSWFSWEATGGTIAVDSLAGSAATFSFESITMVPSTGGTGNQASGSFTFSGTITVDDIQ